MKIVIQRVSECRIDIENELRAQIGKGFLVLVGIVEDDGIKDIEYAAKKISGMRVFEDADGKMNLSLKDVDGEIMLVSQFTLLADIKKGTRPSFIKAAPPSIAVPVYEQLIAELEKTQIPIKTGVFGADMKIGLVNDGPVTIVFDTKEMVLK